MEVMYLLIAFSLLIASGFLLAFIWAVRSGQYDDRYTPSVRMLMDDIMPGKKTGGKRAAPEADDSGGNYGITPKRREDPEKKDSQHRGDRSDGPDRAKPALPVQGSIAGVHAVKKMSVQKKNQQNKIKHTE